MLSPENYSLLQSYCVPRSPNKNEEERFELLKSQRLITVYSHKMLDLGAFGQSYGPDQWVITELGKDALVEFEEHQATNGKQLEAIQNIADSAVRRVELAENEARSARKNAKFSKVLSILSILVAFGSLIVAIFALVLR